MDYIQGAARAVQDKNICIVYAFITKNSTHITNFINISHIWFWNSTHSLKAFERSLADFLPLLPLGSNIKIGVIDYIIKIVGGVLTFGL
ncbi:MAG: hypothetical protein M3044_00685 [Thermoproteota archaeon]|nr:hypothetical protein [Thermoproteota archaeon]